MRLIDADSLIDRVTRMWENRQLTNTKYKSFTEILTAEPTADVVERKDIEAELDLAYKHGWSDCESEFYKERKKGKWITDKYGNVLCSECGWNAPQIMTGCIANRHLDYDKSDFCWRCGSYMREENDNG